MQALYYKAVLGSTLCKFCSTKSCWEVLCASFAVLYSKSSARLRYTENLVCKRRLCVTTVLCKSVGVYDCLCLCVRRLFVNAFVCMNVCLCLCCFCVSV